MWSEFRSPLPLGTMEAVANEADVTRKTKLAVEVPIAKLQKVKQWVNFLEKSREVADAKNQLKQAEEALKIYLKRDLGLADGAVVDFIRTNSRAITVVER